MRGGKRKKFALLVDRKILASRVMAMYAKRFRTMRLRRLAPWLHPVGMQDLKGLAIPFSA